MDITEYVKRNNFAVAQYEVMMRCAAQNRRFSNGAAWLRHKRYQRAPLRAPSESRYRSLIHESVRKRVAVMELSAKIGEYA